MNSSCTCSASRPAPCRRLRERTGRVLRTRQRPNQNIWIRWSAKASRRRYRFYASTSAPSSDYLLSALCARTALTTCSIARITTSGWSTRIMCVLFSATLCRESRDSDKSVLCNSPYFGESFFVRITMSGIFPRGSALFPVAAATPPRNTPLPSPPSDGSGEPT